MTAKPVRLGAKRPPLRKGGNAPAPSEGDTGGMQFHILPASSNLLGISLLTITGLRVANISQHTFADEIAWVAAFCFSTACLLSYLAIRRRARAAQFEHWADRLFLVGLASLLLSVVALALHKTPF